ncbi:hypothetical protein K8Q94_01670 [Candidatus Nomurabacteria bacterium]|nr:hypothetical protein [Candidatus Nomurabacteria bacterium]
MPNERPKFFVDKVMEQKEDDPHPYDALIHVEKDTERMGFVQDNFVCEVVNEKGQESSIRFPTAITYYKSNGSEQWAKKLYGYKEAVQTALESEDMNYYVVYDPSSELSFLAMPFDNNTKIARSRDNLKLFLKNGKPEDTESLMRLMSEFKDVNFGLFGSRFVKDFNYSNKPDIDLIIYGPDDLQKVVDSLENDDSLRNKIGLSFKDSSRFDQYVAYYMEKFNLTESEAKIMFSRRRRYMLNPGIKLSINCALPDNNLNKKIPITIGSKKIHDISIEGTALDTSLSSNMPRVFSIESEGGKIDVVTGIWSLKDFIRTGDKVKVTGALRESNGITFISLEKPSDIIKPITHD